MTSVLDTTVVTFGPLGHGVDHVGWSVDWICQVEMAPPRWPDLAPPLDASH
jgi:hypothetical protein